MLTSRTGQDRARAGVAAVAPQKEKAQRLENGREEKPDALAPSGSEVSAGDGRVRRDRADDEQDRAEGRGDDAERARRLPGGVDAHVRGIRPARSGDRVVPDPGLELGRLGPVGERDVVTPERADVSEAQRRRGEERRQQGEAHASGGDAVCGTKKPDGVRGESRGCT